MHSTLKLKNTVTTQTTSETTNHGLADPLPDPLPDLPPDPLPDISTNAAVELVQSDLVPLKEHLKSGDLLSACRHFVTLTSRLSESVGGLASGDSLAKYLPPDAILQPVLGQLLEAIIIDDGRNLDLPTPLDFLKQMGDIGALRTAHYATLLLSMVKNGANTTSLIPVFDSAILFNSGNLKELMSEIDEFLSLDYDMATPHFIAFLILRSKGISSDGISRLESVLKHSPYPVFHQVERVLDYHNFSINSTTYILALLQEFSTESLYTNNHALRQAINAVLASSATPTALTTLYKSIKDNAPKKFGATVYNIFITSFMELQDLKDPLAAQSAAFSVWNDMETGGITPGVIEWTNLMKSFAKTRDKSVILPLWTRMIQNGIFPDHRAWTVRIHALLEAGMVKEGLESLREMQSSSVTPTVETINAVLSGLLKHEYILEASKVLAVAERLGIQKDIATYNTLLVSLMKQQRSNAKKFDESLALIRQMSANGIVPDIRTITLILDGMYKFSNPKPTLSAVLSLLSYCESAGIPINVWTFTALIRALLEEGREDAAIDMLIAMESRGMTGSTTTYTILLRYYFMRRDLISVDELLDEMMLKRIIMDRRLWREVIVGFAGAGQVDRMKSAIARMHKGATGMDISGFMSTLKKLGYKGLLVDAKEVVQDLLDREIVGRSKEARLAGPERDFWVVVGSLGDGDVMERLIETGKVDA